MKTKLRQLKRRKLTINRKIYVIKSLVSSMITHILLSLPHTSDKYIKEIENMMAHSL